MIDKNLADYLTKRTMERIFELIWRILSIIIGFEDNIDYSYVRKNKDNYFFSWKTSIINFFLEYIIRIDPILIEEDNELEIVKKLFSVKKKRSEFIEYSNEEENDFYFNYHYIEAIEEMIEVIFEFSQRDYISNLEEKKTNLKNFFQKFKKDNEFLLKFLEEFCLKKICENDDEISLMKKEIIEEVEKISQDSFITEIDERIFVREETSINGIVISTYRPKEIKVHIINNKILEKIIYFLKSTTILNEGYDLFLNDFQLLNSSISEWLIKLSNGGMGMYSISFIDFKYYDESGKIEKITSFTNYELYSKIKNKDLIEDDKIFLSLKKEGNIKDVIEEILNKREKEYKNWRNGKIDLLKQKVSELLEELELAKNELNQEYLKIEEIKQLKSLRIKMNGSKANLERFLLVGSFFDYRKFDITNHKEKIISHIKKETFLKNNSLIKHNFKREIGLKFNYQELKECFGEAYYKEAIFTLNKGKLFWSPSEDGLFNKFPKNSDFFRIVSKKCDHFNAYQLTFSHHIIILEKIICGEEIIWDIKNLDKLAYLDFSKLNKIGVTVGFYKFHPFFYNISKELFSDKWGEKALIPYKEKIIENKLSNLDIIRNYLTNYNSSHHKGIDEDEKEINKAILRRYLVGYDDLFFDKYLSDYNYATNFLTENGLLFSIKDKEISAAYYEEKIRIYWDFIENKYKEIRNSNFKELGEIFDSIINISVWNLLKKILSEGMEEIEKKELKFKEALSLIKEYKKKHSEFLEFFNVLRKNVDILRMFPITKIIIEDDFFNDNNIEIIDKYENIEKIKNEGIREKIKNFLIKLKEEISTGKKDKLIKMIEKLLSGEKLLEEEISDFEKILNSNKKQEGIEKNDDINEKSNIYPLIINIEEEKKDRAIHYISKEKKQFLKNYSWYFIFLIILTFSILFIFLMKNLLKRNKNEDKKNSI